MASILCFGDSNTWGAVPMIDWGVPKRFARDVRWTGVMRHALGADIEVIEEGLNGRTTCHDDPIEGRHKNGERALPICLETHQPLDLVVIMLGTNDLKQRFRVPAGDIAGGARRLVRMARTTEVGPDGRAPAVLLACPAPVARLTLFAEMFAGADETSRGLSAAYRGVAEAEGVPFLDLGAVGRSSDVDGIHLDAEAHRALGEAMAGTVRGNLDR
jgi:lysophospholipase L1-like esterase